MNSRRPDIHMSEYEQSRFLAAGATLTVGSVDADGFPHLVSMWYVVIDGLIHFTTYRDSQKVVNHRRNPKVSCLLETGDSYRQLKGLVLQGNAAIVDDIYFTARIRALVGEKYGFNSGDTPDAVTEADAKRVVVRVHPERCYSWDHARLDQADEARV